MTKQQAEKSRHGDILHYTGKHPCAQIIGKLGGETFSIVRCRVSGKCKTWKTRANQFYLPIKHGLYEHGAVNQMNCQNFHLESQCPLNH